MGVGWEEGGEEEGEEEEGWGEYGVGGEHGGGFWGVVVVVRLESRGWVLG